MTNAERMHNVCVNCAVNYMKNVISNIIKVLKVMMDGEIVMYNETPIVAGPVCKKNNLFPVNSNPTRMKNKRYILLSFTNLKHIICEYGESFVFEYLHVSALYCADSYFVFEMINFIFSLI